MRIVIYLILCFTLFISHLSAQVKVVSLSPIVTKTIKMMSAENLLVGRTKWCPEVAGVPIVADAININVEELVKVQPDIVFASTLVSVESIKTIKNLGIEVVLMPRVIDFGVMCSNVILIGKKLNREEEAIDQVKMAKDRLNEIMKMIDVKAKPTVMMQIGANPIFVAIPNTFVHDYIQKAGGVNCYDDITHGTVTRESVLLRNPDAIFLSIMPSMSEHEKQTWKEYSSLSAAVNNKIFMLDQDKTSAPTIHDFVDVVEVMVRALNE